MYDELKKNVAETEELEHKIEKLQLELDHQRELIQKIEMQPPSATSIVSTTSCFVEVPRATPASRESKGTFVTPALGWPWTKPLLAWLTVNTVLLPITWWLLPSGAAGLPSSTKQAWGRIPGLKTHLRTQRHQ